MLTFLLQACEAWKKEAEDANRKAKVAEDEKQQALKQKEEVKDSLPLV